MFPKDFQAKDLLYLNKMVTPSFMTIIYWLMSVVVIIAGLFSVFKAYNVGMAIVTLFGIALSLLFVRLMCEMMIVIFRINANLQKIADRE